jgi:hypothetical protein
MEKKLKSLRTQKFTDEQKENVKTQQFNRLLSAQVHNLITKKEFRETCNKAGLLVFPLK